MNEPKRTFVKKGNKIVVKTDVPNVELDSFQLLHQITQYENAINKNLQDIEQAKKAVEGNEEYLKLNREGLKKVEHFKEWAVGVQESRLKSILKEKEGSCKEKVLSEYVFDEGLTKEQNAAQMFVKYQRMLATLPEVANEIHPNIMKDFLYKNGFLKNPFKP